MKAMLKTILASLFLFVSCPALAVYKCESGGKTIYSDAPCATGQSSDLGDIADKSSPEDVAKARQLHAQEKAKVKQLEKARHQREAQDEKRQQQALKAAAAKKKKCAALEQKKKWSAEDAASASIKRLEQAKLRARRAAEKYEMECGK